MEIIFVNKPVQDENTVNPQYIGDGYPHWVVKSQMLRKDESLKTFLNREFEYHNNKYPNTISGFYIYDVHPINGIINQNGEFTGDSILCVRYALIKNDGNEQDRGCCYQCGEGYDNEEEWKYNTECELCGYPIPENLIIKRNT
jgi:hypothetical protein